MGTKPPRAEDHSQDVGAQHVIGHFYQEVATFFVGTPGRSAQTARPDRVMAIAQNHSRDRAWQSPGAPRVRETLGDWTAAVSAQLASASA